MIPLFDCTLHRAEVAAKEMGLLDFGQLLTPLTQYKRWNEWYRFGIDNGAYSGGFDAGKFRRLLARNWQERHRCRFVSAPDVVGNAAATMGLFDDWHEELSSAGWPLALVTQDGLRLQDVPWGRIKAIFVGGTDGWKFCSSSSMICAEAKRRGLWVHVGRVNSWQRAMEAENFGADSFDGTGIVRFSGMRTAFRDGMRHPRLPLEVGP